ncbi:hypothetical protein BBJ28_00015105 [Nothophytophthora sp. Chile5]|nr:hypothetical protein BBJ28_00015105 [Nothophytophthora sp. Chile5]
MNHGPNRTDDADTTAALATQGNNGDRHSLEAIMNTDDASPDDHPQLTTAGVAGKGSLAFILGGAEETETSGPTFGTSEPWVFLFLRCKTLSS